MPSLRPIADEPIAIRRALEDGWRGFCRHGTALVSFCLSIGSLNLLSWLLYRHSGGLLDGPMPQQSLGTLVEALVALLAYLLSGFWLLSGLIRGAERALDGAPSSLRALLRPDGSAIARMAWSTLVLLLVLALVQQSCQVSAWLLTLISPMLAPLPLWAAWIVWLYLIADQVLLLPITVLGNQAGLAAFASGRRATDPHWLQALGLLALVALILLAGFVLLIGLVVALPVALCTLTAAYRQLFVMPMVSGPSPDLR